MHVVVDASLLAGTLVDVHGAIGRRYRERLAELVGDDRAYINITPYDAMYVAATEQLMSDHDGNAVLATADGRLANAPRLSIPVERFSPEDL